MNQQALWIMLLFRLINKTLNKLKEKYTIVLVTHNVDILPDVDEVIQL